MIDMHYDLLSIIYQSYLRMDYSYLEEWLSNYNSDNVSGLLANMYFMSPEEMKEELGETLEEIDVLEMFKKAIEVFNKYNLNIDILFSIEGCDYIKDTEELEKLYELGLRNILLVWNNPNKYGSGNRGDYGLTELGKEFIRKAVDLGISIDLSHMNEKTFKDTVSLLKTLKGEGKEVKVIASHSNSYNVCPHMRNLDDDELMAIKELDGIVGVVSYSEFVLDNSATDEKLKKAYLKHIKYMVDMLGIDHVGVASDDMTFDNYFYSGVSGKMVFNYKTIKNDLVELLSTDFNKEEIDKILYKNVYNKLFKEEVI
jgi:membrane dipeptidase